MSGAGFLAAGLLAWAIGFLTLLGVLHPRQPQPPPPARMALIFALAFPAGLALTSASYHLWCQWVGPRTLLPLYVLIEIVLLTALIAWNAPMFAKLPLTPPLRKVPGTPVQRDWFMLGGCLLFGLLLLLFLQDWWTTTLQEPQGEWDAWAMWNMKARFLFSGDTWRGVFSPLIYGVHPDYPFLLPSSIARVWVLGASRSLWVPPVLHLAMMLSIPLIGWAALREEGTVSPVSALSAAMLLLTSLRPHLYHYQYADLPTGLFFLCALTCSWLAIRGETRALTLAGLFCGAALWTKNEGWVMTISVVIALCLVALTTRRWKDVLPGLLRFAAGIVPFVVVHLVFRANLPVGTPPNDLTSGFQAAALLDLPRQLAILSAMAAGFIRYNVQGLPISGLAVLVPLLLMLLERRRPRRGAVWLLLSCALLMTGYYGVYAVMGYDPLAWLGNSFPRLLLHFIPAFVLSLFLLFTSGSKRGYAQN